MALFGRTEGNLLNEKTYAEISTFYENSMKMNLTIDDKEYYQFNELCHPLCGLNIPLQKLMVCFLSFITILLIYVRRNWDGLPKLSTRLVRHLALM